MANVAVVYHSDSGHTKILAEAVLEGASSVDGTKATLHEVDRRAIVEGRFEGEEMLAELDGADAIVFGCPTYMGGISGPMKAFVDATLNRWYARKWSDKLAAGFTVSSTPSGDKLNTLMGLQVAAMQLGMIWVGLDQSPLNPDGLNRLSFYLGVGGQAEYGGEETAIDPGDRATGVLLGARVARLAGRLA